MTNNILELESNHSFDGVHKEQLQLYALDVARLHALLKAQTAARLQAQTLLRKRGTGMESLAQVLTAACTSAQLVLDTDISPKLRQSVANNLPELIGRAMAIVKGLRQETATSGGDDLGLIAMLRQEVFVRASLAAWDAEVEMDRVYPCATSEVAAYVVVQEALRRAGMDHSTRRVKLAVGAREDKLVIELLTYHDAEAHEKAQCDNASTFLMRTYARHANGHCRWERAVSDGEVEERMELVLPMGMPEMTPLGED